MNGEMTAAIAPIVPYGLSKTTHAAIKKQIANRTARVERIAEVRKYLFKATLPPVRARREAIY